MRGLPESIARQLLAQLEPDLRSRVRREIAGLVDVDPMEQHRAVESFAGLMRRGASRQSEFPVRDSSSDTADEVRFSQAAEAAAPPRRQVSPAAVPSDTPLLSFLDRIGDDDLLMLLQDEHPQTKAVVLAQIPPARAAALLPRLGAAQRQDLLSRIGRLPNLPEEMLAELANSFRVRVDRMLENRSNDPLQNMAAILATQVQSDADKVARHVAPGAAAVSPRLQAILAEMPSALGGNSAAPANDEQAEFAAQRLRQITRDESPGTHPRGTSASSTTSSHLPANTRPPADVSGEWSSAAIHQELMVMPPRKLCESLGRVDTRTAILALCGLPNKVADAAIACLPRQQANQVRGQLMSVGSIEIRDIDRAKEQVVLASRIGGRVDPASAAVAAATRTSPTQSSATSSMAARVAVAM